MTGPGTREHDLAALETKAELRAIKSCHNNLALRFNSKVVLPPTTARASNIVNLKAEIQTIMVTLEALRDEGNEAVESATAALECDATKAKTMDTAEKARLKNELARLEEIKTSEPEWKTKVKKAQQQSATGARATEARRVHEGFIKLSDRLRSFVRSEAVGVHEVADILDCAVKSTFD